MVPFLFFILFSLSAAGSQQATQPLSPDDMDCSQDEVGKESAASPIDFKPDNLTILIKNIQISDTDKFPEIRKLILAGNTPNRLSAHTGEQSWEHPLQLLSNSLKNKTVSYDDTGHFEEQYKEQMEEYAQRIKATRACIAQARKDRIAGVQEQLHIIAFPAGIRAIIASYEEASF